MRFRWLLALATVAACQSDPEVTQQTDEIGTPGACDWPQIYGSADHSGRVCPEIGGLTVVDRLPQDDDADAEIESNGFLQVHEGSPLTLGDYVVVPHKRGFTDVFHEGTTVYTVDVYKWSPSVLAASATLERQWSVDTDFATVDAVLCSFGCMTNGYVQEWDLAVANGSVYAPISHGRLLRLSLATGAVQATIDPLVGTTFDGDARTIVDSSPTVLPDGSLVYTVTAWPTDASPFGRQPRASWLVKVLPTNDFVIAEWATVASPTVGVPRPTDLCEYPFGTGGQNPLTGPTSKPPKFGCGTQRPALNAPVAYSPALGRLVAFSYANNARDAAFLVEIDPATLAPIVAADLRNNDLFYGCGVRLSLGFPGCNVITAGGTVNIGVDPQFGSSVRLRTPADIMNSAPVVSPDGSVMGICSYDGGFSFSILFGGGGDYDAQGSCVFYNTSDGSFHSSDQSFGWEVTPSAQPTAPLGLGFVWLKDRNLYNDGHLGVARYDSNNELQNTAEVANFPFGDFVDTNITFGARGDHYGYTEGGDDGARFYKIDAAGHLVDSVQLTPDSIEVLSGPVAVDRRGRRYVSYAGSVFVVSSDGTPTTPLRPSHPGRSTRRLATLKAVDTPEPGPPVVESSGPSGDLQICCDGDGLCGSDLCNPGGGGGGGGGSCGLQSCNPNSCSGGGNCVHDPLGDLQCRLVGCGACADFTPLDTSQCDRAYLPRDTPEYGACFDRCMNSKTHTCDG